MINRRHALLLLSALPAACTSPNPTLYTLAVMPGTVLHGAPATIELREVVLAHYLERSQIVRSSEGFRIEVLGIDWWGEPLGSMMNRILVQELGQRLPDSTVFAENTAISITADVNVGINIQRLDADATGAVILLAQVAISGRRTSARTLRLSVVPPSAGTAGLVSAMSTATAQLADAVAGMLVGR